MNAIETRQLTKRYGELTAVSDFNFSLGNGECLGLLGPNGAGKTTLIRMITAISPPTAGEIRVLGRDIRTHAREVKAVMGVVPQFENLDPDLDVIKNLTVFARYYDITGKEAMERSLALLELFKLKEKARCKIDELSGGMKRRLLLARSLINRPRIMILDEPTVGLDPQSKYLVWNKLRELKTEGVTELICTQNMEEAASLCDRVAIMHQGKLLALDEPKSLVNKHTGKRLWEIQVSPEQKEQALSELKALGCEFEDTGKDIYVFHAEEDHDLSGIAIFRGNSRKRDANLEDVFFKLTGRTLSE